MDDGSTRARLAGADGVDGESAALSGDPAPKPTPLRYDYQRALGRVAHDIRSATGVAWTALTEIERGTLRDDGAQSGIESFLKIGQRSLRRLLLLADRLTLAGAIEEGGLELSRCETSAGELLRHVVDDIGFALGRRTVAVVLEDVPESAKLDADARWLGAALGELLGNAIRFARTRVVVGVVEDGPEVGSVISIRIEDDGPGLPDAARASLTEGAPTAEPAHGLGLSLPLAHRIIAAHGGRVRVEQPASGSGTVLFVSIPRAQRQSAP